MLTHKGAALSVASLAIIATGVAFQIPYVLYVAATMAAFIVLARAIGRVPGPITVDVERRLEDKLVYEGDAVEAELVVSNRGKSLDSVEVRETLPEGMAPIEGATRWILTLREKERIRLRYKVEPSPFGTYSFGPSFVRVTDTFGLFAEERKYGAITTVMAHPLPDMERREAIQLRSLRNWPGEILSNTAGQGTEFYSLREYLPGDTFRTVNWNASAKFDSLWVNQYRGERGAQLVIVVDASPMTIADVSREPIPVVSLRAAATIAHSLLATRNSVGLLVLGEGLSSASCGSGRKQLELILNVLSHSKVGRTWELIRVPDLLGLRFPGLRQVMVITPMVDDSSLDAIARISGTGHIVTVISPSPYHPKESLMSTKPEVLAEKLLILDRASRLTTARGFAIVVDWQSGEPLLPRLRQAQMIDRRR